MIAARRAAVLGRPVAHSLSPALHRAAYAELGLTGWRYEVHEVGDEPSLRAFVESCGPQSSGPQSSGAPWAGLSLTMPLKRMVQPLLDELSPTAAAVGSVNTVVFGPNGRVGDNTDVTGVVRALADGGVRALATGQGVVLGGGATAASALAALVELGDFAPSVVVRSLERAAQVRAAGERLGAHPQLVTFDAAPTLLGRATAVVSTVPASGVPTAECAVRSAGPVRGVLLDVVYDPWRTATGRAWEAAGGVVVGGFAMLLHQAVEQVRLMTGRTPSVEGLRAAGMRELEARRLKTGPAAVDTSP